MHCHQEAGHKETKEIIQKTPRVVFSCSYLNRHVLFTSTQRCTMYIMAAHVVPAPVHTLARGEDSLPQTRREVRPARRSHHQTNNTMRCRKLEEEPQPTVVHFLCTTVRLRLYGKRICSVSRYRRHHNGVLIPFLSPQCPKQPPQSKTTPARLRNANACMQHKMRSGPSPRLSPATGILCVPVPSNAAKAYHQLKGLYERTGATGKQTSRGRQRQQQKQRHP